MTVERIQQAACNNALWCDAVCRVHGRPGVFSADAWVNRHETPPYYPNVVTLTEAGSAAQLGHIGTLRQAQIPGEWGVKDSFCSLALAPLGFRILSEAQWIYRSASLPRPTDTVPGVRWGRIKTEPALAEWETSWRGGLSSGPAIFPPALLRDDDIAVLAAWRDHVLIAGVIANRTGEVVGLSNLFVGGNDHDEARAGCVGAVIDAFPGLPIVGYESGPELAAARALGFEDVGPLRIWVNVTNHELCRGRATV